MGEPAAVDPGTVVVFCIVVGALIAAILAAVIKYHYDKRRLKRQGPHNATQSTKTTNSHKAQHPNDTQTTDHSRQNDDSHV